MAFNQILYGGLIIQILLLIFYFLLFKKIEFLYLMVTGIFMLVFITLVIYPHTVSYFHDIGMPFTSEVRNAFIFFGMASYYMFLAHLLGHPEKHVFFGKVINFASIVLFISGVLYLVRNLLGANGIWLIYILIPVFFLNYLMQAYSVYYLFKTKQSKLVPIACASLFLFLITKFTVLPGFRVNDLGAHVMDSPWLVMVGVNLNFFFFTVSMVYEMWKNLRDLSKIELEKAIELYQQRVDISNDLHDDLGATLSSLHIYSSIAQKYVDVNPVKTRANLDHISKNVFTLMEKINDVIWSVSTKQSNVSLLSTRIKDCFVNIFDAAGIKCTYEIDENLETGITGLKARKLLLLFAKEAINNAIKHSCASSIRFSIQKSNDNLLMAIKDNGKGIGDLNFDKGNGLSNLKHRADQLNGHFSIETLKSGGTLVECMIPLTSISL